MKEYWKKHTIKDLLWLKFALYLFGVEYLVEGFFSPIPNNMEHIEACFFTEFLILLWSQSF